MVEQHVAEKKVTWGELFFDLVFVFAVTQISSLVHADHSWAGVGRAAVVFVPIWWAWVGTSIHANTHDVDNPLDRIGIFAVALGGLFMSLALTDPYGRYGPLFGGGYLALRIVLAALVFRGPRLTLNAFSVGLVVTGPLLLLGGFLDGGWRIAVWGLAALTDLAVPGLIRRRLAQVHFEASHLPERFGLFLIVALGESIVAIGVSARADPLSPLRLTAVAAAFVLSCALWWLYFVFAVNAVRYAVETAQVQTDIIRQVLAYGHLAFIASIIAVAVGLAEAVAHPGDHLHAGVAALLVGGVSLYLSVFGYTRWRMFRVVSTTRLTAGVLVLPLIALSQALPAVVVLGLLVVVLVGLNAVEGLQVHRTKARAEAQRQPAVTEDLELVTEVRPGA
jgi:low temperature requirement protein LtrA